MNTLYRWDSARGAADYWQQQVIKLARFLRDNFPEEVRENMEKPLEQSNAVTLAMELLAKYKESQDASR